MKKILCLLAALLPLAFCAGANVLPAEQLLPEDTLVLLSVPDFTKLSGIYSSIPQVRLWADPAMKPFRDKFTAKFKTEIVSPMEHDLGIHLDDYTSLPQGQLTIALVQNGWQGKDDDTKTPGFLFLLDAKDKSSQLKTNLADLKKKWVDAGKTVHPEKIRDIEFSAITLSTNDLPEALKKAVANQADSSGSADKPADAAKPPTTTLYIGQAESLLIVGNSTKTIEKVLAAMSGGDVRTLSQVPAFSANYDAMFRNSPMFAWVNVRAFLDVAKQAGDSAGSSEFSPSKIFSAVGLDGLKTIAVSYKFSSDGVLGNVFIGVPEGDRSGLFKLLAGEAKDCSPPPFVPADAVKFQRWRIDGQKFWDGLRKIVNDISPQSLGAVDFMLSSAESQAKQKDPDFDLKKNLFGNLGDDVITYQKSPKGSSLTTMSQPSIFLLGSPHPDQLAGALNALMVLVAQDSAPTSRDFLGRKIYSLPVPSPGMPSSGTNSSAPTLSYASSGGYLAITTDTPMLEEYLRSADSQGKSLRDAPGLATATEKVVGSGTSLFGYSNERETMRMVVNMLKQDSSGGLGNLAPLLSTVGMDDSGLKDWIDTSLLPDFDQISKYFSFSVYSGSATPDGLSFKVYEPAAQQLSQ